jgi:hypothetical protein
MSWYLLNYIASADVASRTVRVIVTLVNGVTLELGYLAVTASQNKKLSWGCTMTSGTSPNDYNTGGQGLMPLYPGQAFSISVAGAQAADTWTLEGVYFDCPRGAE